MHLPSGSCSENFQDLSVTWDCLLPSAEMISNWAIKAPGPPLLVAFTERMLVPSLKVTGDIYGHRFVP